MIRINRFFTDKGFCSRREADRYILEGRVSINGRKAVLGDKITGKDEISLDGKVFHREGPKKVILAYHKAPGIECTSDPLRTNNIIKAVNYPERIFHIGRLDKNTEGLILLTNRGEIVNEILRSENEHEKEYYVEVETELTQAMLSKLRNGMDIGDGRGLTKKCVVEKIGTKNFKIILTEGRFHQIRKMVTLVGNKVKKLRRERVMSVNLGSLKRGEYRLLTEQETQTLLSSL